MILDKANVEQVCGEMKPTNDTGLRFRYEIRSLKASSVKFGNCEVCGQHVSETFSQWEFEWMGFDDDDCDWVSKNIRFGHETCLLSIRKTVPLVSDEDPHTMPADCPGDDHQLDRMGEDWDSLLVAGQNTNPTTDEPTARRGEDPIFTTPGSVWKGMPKALLVGGANTSDAQCAPGVGVSADSEPTRCVNANNADQWRAVLVSNAKTEFGDGTREGWPPSFTTTPEQGGRLRALLEQGRVVKMTDNCLYRFQGVPDWYPRPQNRRLSAQIAGNGCAVQLQRAIVLPMLLHILGERLSR